MIIILKVIYRRTAAGISAEVALEGRACLALRSMPVCFVFHGLENKESFDTECGFRNFMKKGATKQGRLGQGRAADGEARRRQAAPQRGPPGHPERQTGK